MKLYTAIYVVHIRQPAVIEKRGKMQRCKTAPIFATFDECCSNKQARCLPPRRQEFRACRLANLAEGVSGGAGILRANGRHAHPEK